MQQSHVNILVSPTAKVWKYCLSSLFKKKISRVLVFSRNTQGPWKSLNLAKSKHYRKQQAAQGKCTHETHSALGTISPDYRFIEHAHVSGRCETVTASNHLVLCKLILSALPVWGSSPDMYRFPITAIAKRLWHQRSSSHWSLMELMVARSFFQMLLQFGMLSFCRIRSHLPIQRWAAGTTVTSQKSWAGALRKLSGEAGTTL